MKSWPVPGGDATLDVIRTGAKHDIALAELVVERRVAKRGTQFGFWQGIRDRIDRKWWWRQRDGRRRM